MSEIVVTLQRSHVPFHDGELGRGVLADANRCGWLRAGSLRTVLVFFYTCIDVQGSVVLVG